MKKYWSDSSSIGKLSILTGLFVAVPLLILPWYPDDRQYLLAFLIPSLSSILLGLIICVCGKRDAEASMNWRSQMGRSNLTVFGSVSRSSPLSHR